MKKRRKVKYYLYINNMSMTIMNAINEVSKKSRPITNKIISVGEKIKLSISNLSIKVRNSINEFIHPSRYENKIIFNAKSTFLKNKNLIISNEEKRKTDCLNKKAYLKEEQSNHKNGVVEKNTVIANNTQSEDSNSLEVDKPINNSFSNAIRKVKSDEIKESVINDIISSLEEIATLEKEKITEFKRELYFNSKWVLFSGDAISLAKIKNDFVGSIVDTILNSDDKIKSNIGNVNSYKYFLQDSINNAADDILNKN